MCVAVTEVEVDIVIVVLVFIAAVHMRVFARGRFSSMVAAVIILMLDCGRSRFSAGSGRLWSGRGRRRRLIVVASQTISDSSFAEGDRDGRCVQIVEEIVLEVLRFRHCEGLPVLRMCELDKKREGKGKIDCVVVKKWGDINAKNK